MIRTYSILKYEPKLKNRVTVQIFYANYNSKLVKNTTLY